jgi:hypothetical protein
MRFFMKKSSFQIRSGPGNVVTITGLGVTAKCRINTESISFFKQRIDSEIFDYRFTNDSAAGESDIVRIVTQALNENMGRSNEFMVYLKGPSQRGQADNC